MIKYFLLVIAGILFFTACSNITNTNTEILVEEIHSKYLTIDTHVDTPLRLLDTSFNIALYNNPSSGRSKLDFPRMKAGGLDAAFFAVFVGQGERTPEGNLAARDKAVEICELIHKTITDNNNLAELALTPADAYNIKKDGTRVVFIGMENGYPIGKDISLVKYFYDLGVRYITLCHTKNNDICDSSNDEMGPEHNGVSEFGKNVIEEMNRLGIIIDVSHISDKAFFDVLEYSEAPVIASHSCSRALCDNPRNISDEMLRKLAENGGSIQMCIFTEYVNKPEPDKGRDSAVAAFRAKYNEMKNLTGEEEKDYRIGWRELNSKFPRKLAAVADVVDHIDHIVEVAGIDHVGIGTDFDGGGGVDGCFDVSQMKNITRELIKRGYSKEEIGKIWGKNLIRVFREVERIAEGD